MNVSLRMHPFVRVLFVIALVPSLLPGCALWHKLVRTKQPAANQEKVPKPAQLIGTIVLVNTEGGFVLIDNGSRPSPTMGTTAEGRSPDGSSAQLRVTEVRKRPFVIGDIVSGAPRVGDAVYQ